MENFKLGKKCEVCDSPIPDDFGNLLCLTCYDKQVKEIEEKRKQDIAELNGNLQITTNQPVVSNYNVNGVTDPNYVENPQAEDKEQVAANLTLFQKTGKLLWYPTRDMYEFIKNYCMTKVTHHPQYPKYIWKPKIVDVGCGSGVGSNILSQEADFVWGIDKNEKSIQFAKQAFERQKNNIYYSSQVDFDVIDLVNDTREFMKFDIVVAIEIIEHIFDYKGFLRNLIRFAKRNKNGYAVEDPTEFFISTPNRNSAGIEKKKPKNPYHVREWTSQEFHAVLSETFKNVEFFNSKGESVGIDTDTTPLLAKCSLPK